MTTNSTTETPAPAETATGETTTPDPTTEGEQTFTADYVKQLRAEAAKYRTEAKTNADAARKLAEIEESQKTEAQKLADARDAAIKEATDARAEALRYRIAGEHGISAEDTETFLTGNDEETLKRQAERLAAMQVDGSKVQPGPRPDLSQGARSGEAATGDPAQDFAEFLGGQIGR